MNHFRRFTTMKFRKLFWLPTILIFTIILSACNLGATPAPTEDPGAVQTQAFNLVLTQAASQQTQTALAVPPTQAPTNTLLPTATFITLGGATITPFAFNTQQPRSEERRVGKECKSEE